MKIINDTAVYEPSECYFGLDYVDDEELVVVVITDKQTWDEEGAINDCFGTQSLPENILPDYMSEIMEATWDAESSLEEVKSDLIKAGFVENEAISKIASNYY